MKTISIFLFLISLQSAAFELEQLDLSVLDATNRAVTILSNTNDHAIDMNRNQISSLNNSIQMLEDYKGKYELPKNLNLALMKQNLIDTQILPLKDNAITNCQLYNEKENALRKMLTIISVDLNDINDLIQGRSDNSIGLNQRKIHELTNNIKTLAQEYSNLSQSLSDISSVELKIRWNWSGIGKTAIDEMTTVYDSISWDKLYIGEGQNMVLADPEIILSFIKGKIDISMDNSSLLSPSAVLGYRNPDIILTAITSPRELCSAIEKNSSFSIELTTSQTRKISYPVVEPSPYPTSPELINPKIMGGNESYVLPKKLRNDLFNFNFTDKFRLSFSFTTLTK